MSQPINPACSAGTDINVAFGRTLLRVVMDDINKVTTAAERKAAWVYKLGRDQWEFHGPENFYWYGDASNAYDARATGWQKWWAQLEADAARMEARQLGQQMRANTTTKRVMIVRRGHKLCAGYVCFNAKAGGWQFLPQFQAKPSRKRWPTADAAVKGRIKGYTLEDAPKRESSHPSDVCK